MHLLYHKASRLNVAESDNETRLTHKFDHRVSGELHLEKFNHTLSSFLLFQAR